MRNVVYLELTICRRPILFEHNCTSSYLYVSVPPQRRPDYEHVPGLGYYKLHNVVSNFQDAYNVCLSEGTHLVILNSEAEFNAIRNKNKYSWVGVNDIKVTGDFKTIFCE